MTRAFSPVHLLCISVLAAAAAGGCRATTPRTVSTAGPPSSQQTVGPFTTPPLPARPAIPQVTVVAQAGTPGLVTIRAGGVTPATIAIQAGRTVNWLNADSVAHRIVSDQAGIFDTGEIQPGQSAAVTLNTPGTYNWRDALTPELKGTVRVLR